MIEVVEVGSVVSVVIPVVDLVYRFLLLPMRGKERIVSSFLHVVVEVEKSSL